MADSQQANEPSKAGLAGSTQGASGHARIERRQVLRYVLVFILSAAVLLTTGRYAVNTGPMNWYLFQVARPTSWALGLIGHASALENPAPHEEQTRAIRAALAAWRRGEDPPPLVGESHGADSPVTSYEVWQYRAMRVARELDGIQARAANLAPLPLPNSSAPEEYVDYVQARLEQLALSMAPDGDATCPELAEFISQASEEFKGLARTSNKTDKTFSDSLNALSGQVESFRLRQLAYLERRMARLAEQEAHLGPGVDFVARAAPPGGEEVRFMFHVAPDCGALPSMSIFVAAVLAFPTVWRKRMAGILLGIPLLFLVNVLRLVCLGVIGAYTNGGDTFTFAHEYVWQGLYIVFVVAAWLLWVEFIVRPRRHA